MSVPVVTPHSSKSAKDGAIQGVNKSAADMSGVLRDIALAHEKGNFGRAEQYIRQGEAAAPDMPYWPYFRGLVAFKLGMRAAGLVYCARAREILAGDNRTSQTFPELAPELDALENALNNVSENASHKTQAPFKTQAPLGASVQQQESAYLLIKSWGYGFWSDIGHFVSALLLAEMTGRLPVIHWGAGCRYSDDPDTDAFAAFFNPVNDLTLASFVAPEDNFYPEKWSRDNLTADRFEQWSGLGARQSGLYLLNRPESVVVADFYTQIFELLPWLPTTHWLAGDSPHDAFARLYRKYFVLRPEIQGEIDRFAAMHIRGRPTLAVHVRNTDKASESAQFADDVAQIAPMVESCMAKDRALRLFLLSDSTQAVDFYRSRYGARVFFTDSARADGDVGVHVQGAGSKHQLGVDVLKDTYLAAACDAFIGLGTSNLPCMVSVLKDWPTERIHLIGANRLLQENFLLHDW